MGRHRLFFYVLGGNWTRYPNLGLLPALIYIFLTEVNGEDNTTASILINDFEGVCEAGSPWHCQSSRHTIELSCDERLYVTLLKLRNQSAFAVEIVMPMGEDPRHGILAALVVAVVGLLLLIVAAFAVAPVLVLVLGAMTYVVWWYVSKEGTSYLHHAQVGVFPRFWRDMAGRCLFSQTVFFKIWWAFFRPLPIEDSLSQ